MKTFIKSLADNRVEIRFKNLFGDICEYRIQAPRDGGYVRLEDETQLCDRLSVRGSTLYWSGTYPLIDLVRREYRSMRHYEKRLEAL